MWRCSFSWPIADAAHCGRPSGCRLKAIAGAEGSSFAPDDGACGRKRCENQPCQRPRSFREAFWRASCQRAGRSLIPDPGGYMPRATHREKHSVSRIGWLRAAVMGANDGIVSTSSLIVGVAAAEASRAAVLVAGVAALVAGAMSMAAGEYVSVSSQADTERADLARESAELAGQPELEREELANIYVRRGLDPALALQVADELM